MEASPLTQWLEAIDRLDADAAVAPLADDVQALMADGRTANGRERVAAVIVDFLSQLYAVSHEVTAQWHVDDVWIAEAQATYELTDHFRTGPLARALIVRSGAHGITDLRVYGAHEHPLSEHRTGEEGMFVGGRWVPPL